MTLTSSGIDTTYNGWNSYEAWNISLYINNEYYLYTLARDWVQERTDNGESIDYDVFRHTLNEVAGICTADGVEWNDVDDDDIAELSEMLAELNS